MTALYKLTCPVCHKPFEAKRRDAKTCGDVCRQELHRSSPVRHMKDYNPRIDWAALGITVPTIPETGAVSLGDLGKATETFEWERKSTYIGNRPKPVKFNVPIKLARPAPEPAPLSMTQRKALGRHGAGTTEPKPAPPHTVKHKAVPVTMKPVTDREAGIPVAKKSKPVTDREAAIARHGKPTRPDANPLTDDLIRSHARDAFWFDRTSFKDVLAHIKHLWPDCDVDLIKKIFAEEKAFYDARPKIGVNIHIALTEYAAALKAVKALPTRRKGQRRQVERSNVHGRLTSALTDLNAALGVDY